jgi:HSP90 family molecular chaperone
MLLSNGICNDREFKEKIARLIIFKTFYSNQCRLLEEDVTDLKSKCTAQSNLIVIEKEKTDVWKSKAGRSWLTRLLDVVIFGIGIVLGLSLNR